MVITIPVGRLARRMQRLLGRVQPVAWIALVAGISLLIALNHTLSTLYSSLTPDEQFVVIIILIVILSVTGFSAISVKGIMKDIPKGKRRQK